MPTEDRIFLSYAHENKFHVRRIHDGLRKRNLKIWFDEESMGPGTWLPQTGKAIARSRFFIFCLSQASLMKIGLEKPGFADDELNRAVEYAFLQPKGKFTIIPVRLEDCDRGDHRLSVYHQYDLFDDENFETALDKLAVKLGGTSLSDLGDGDDRTERVKDVDSLLGKATMAYFADNFDLALSLAETAIDVEPDNFGAWNIKGMALNGLEKKDEAVLAFDKVVKQIPQDYGAWYNKGLVLFDLGKKDEAIHAFDEAIKIFSSSEIRKEDRASEIVSKLISELKSQIKTAEESYLDDVETWSSYARADEAHGHLSDNMRQSMIDYYDNEVRVSYAGLQDPHFHSELERQNNRLQAEIRSMEERIERLKEIERLFGAHQNALPNLGKGRGALTDHSAVK